MRLDLFEIIMTVIKDSNKTTYCTYSVQYINKYYIVQYSSTVLYYVLST
jgi:hypothetical protein